MGDLHPAKSSMLNMMVYKPKNVSHRIIKDGTEGKGKN
jgi:hypothetical protein